MQTEENSQHEAATGLQLKRPRPSTLPSAAPDFSVWRTVLRRWWVVLLFAAIGGVLGVAYAESQPIQYQAEAVVVATKSRIPREDISSVLETVFPTDPVLESVVADLGLRHSAHALISQGTLSADSETGGSLVISARESSPEVAEDLANSAARNFAFIADDKGLGTFAVLEARDTSATGSEVTRQLAAIGIGLGGLIGASLVFGLYFLRQPILTEREATQELVSEASLAGHVRLPPLPSFMWTGRRSVQRVRRVIPKEIAPAVLRAAVDGTVLPAKVCCILVERRRFGGRKSLRPGRIPPAERILLDLMNAEPYSEGASLSPHAGIEVSWIGSRDDRLTEAVFPSAGVVVLVRAGCPRPSLQSVAEELYASAGHKRRVTLFVTVSRSLL